MVTKSGLMVGAGETNDEVLAVMDDLRAADVDVITIGQYLAPTTSHWPIDRFVTPAEFATFKQEGLSAASGTSRAARWCDRATMRTSMCRRSK